VRYLDAPFTGVDFGDLAATGIRANWTTMWNAVTPVEQPAGDQVLDVDNRTYNTLLRGLRCLGERGFAVLTGRRRPLHHTTAGPSW
jgi:hypothetical protein